MCLIQISSPKFDIEHGELLLYQNMVLREAGRPGKALDHLMEYEPLMHDKLVVREIKGKNYVEQVIHNSSIENPELWLLT